MEWPTIPKTCSTPQLTIVSAIRSVTVATCGSSLDADEDLAVADLERVGDRLVVEPGGLAVERAVVEAVPRAAQQAVLDRALAERPALVRAVVVERRELPVVVDERDALVAGRDRRDAALGQLVGGEDAVPLVVMPSALPCGS